MNNLHMATLFSDVVEMRSPMGPTEGGQFEVPVNVDEIKMLNSGSPQSWFFRELALHLAQAMVDTGIAREYWYVKFTREARIRFNLPEVTRMGK